jgi:tRNA G18 (ribose-2'-O)-methylase SpoU
MAQTIEGPDDPRLAMYRHVGDPAWLEAQGLFVAEGRFVVQRVVDVGWYEIVSILVTAAAFDRLRDQLDGVQTEVFVASQATLDGVTGFKFHRGCLALVRRPAERSTDSLLRGRTLVALEGVGNPDNVGGVFRSAAAFSADGILLDPTCADPFYRKAVRTSMGSVLRVPFVRVNPWPDRLDELRASGFTLVALSPAGRQSIDEFVSSPATPDRLVLLAGAEGSGLSEATQAACHTSVRIPIDPASDSLNVVVAVSIALHRLVPPPFS